MEVPEVHPLNFALTYAPPTLVMHYYVGSNTSQEFVHKVSFNFEKNANADRIVKELISKESVYFHPKIVPSEQLKRLVQKLIDNKGKKIGKAKLKPSTVGKSQVEEIPLTKQSNKKKPEVPSLAGRLPGPAEQQDFDDLKPKGKPETKKGAQNQHSEEMFAEPEDQEDMIHEAVDADGQTIKLQKVRIEGMNREVLMDEHGNLYDMEGNHIGTLDEDAEEYEDKPRASPMDLPEIPPYKPKGNKRSHSP
eukprot:TRINITY_DN1648_c0_g2_i16.p1 TRINITY_DN1648_c0_g2~~TRINITY_DN1648_c0_g2_i16.p1  ORF type:complete len:249 (+),score=85.82 TRINITY_DN1648_c0_g2_i16:113-859(+)